MEEQQHEVQRLCLQLSNLKNENEGMQNVITPLEVENEEQDKLEASTEKVHETELAEMNKEEQQHEIDRLHLQLSNLENENEGIQNVITSLEVENEEQDKLQASTEKVHETKLPELNEELSNLENENEGIQNVITSLEVENEGQDKLQVSTEKVHGTELTELNEEDQWHDIQRLRLQLSNLENENEGIQNVITSLEVENEGQDKLQASTEKVHETEIAELNKEINELESKIQELEVISSLRRASIEKAEEQCISLTTDSSEELLMLEAEKCEAWKTYSELQKGTEELNAQNNLLASETNELSEKISELCSKLALTVEECNMSNEKMEALQEENLIMKGELEMLKGKVVNHSSKGNSLFAEVEVSRQQLKNEAKKQKEQLLALQNTYSQTVFEIRKLMKENAKMSEELEHAKEQRSTEELKLQLTTYKRCIKDLEDAQKIWDQEEAAGPIVRGQDDETGKFYDNLLREEREKTKQVWERCEDIMARYIAATEEVAATEREKAVVESMKLRAEAEIVKLKLQLLKSEEDNHKENVLQLVVERCPLKEVQNIRKSKFAAEEVDCSTRKLLTKKEADKRGRLTCS
ncbi:myosin-2 heavy chain-like isoform X2 [Schistocerca serialis cubense]|uniref:myosin-2 heavy chain-like isoform X2 n=1 Tax=Schistocerca serialis cubense TaxID=2023355 RepID=UPI00214EBC4B|nr:myosin-2 heavy chain-like isoform X2 [Schistocerca serialis cubense]